MENFVFFSLSLSLFFKESSSFFPFGLFQLWLEAIFNGSWAQSGGDFLPLPHWSFLAAFNSGCTTKMLFSLCLVAFSLHLHPNIGRSLLHYVLRLHFKRVLFVFALLGSVWWECWLILGSLLRMVNANLK